MWRKFILNARGMRQAKDLAIAGVEDELSKQRDPEPAIAP
jgi:hypothetical protein